MNIQRPCVFFLLAACLWNTSNADFRVEANAAEGVDLPMGTRVIRATTSLAKGMPRLVVGDNQFLLNKRLEHENGDITWADPAGQVLLTQGQRGLFGTIRNGANEFWMTSNPEGSWAVPLAHVNERDSCGTIHHATRRPRTIGAKGSEPIIDVLIVYTRALAQRYPGELLETRLNQYMAVANLGFANSDLSVRTRLVGFREVPYAENTSNGDALYAMSETLAGTPRAGLENLPAFRRQTGADLVIMIRPHDIETRGSCGIAFYPDGTPQLGVNVVSDGMSSWSLCSDLTLVHEIGHNLGAAHQIGAGGGSYDVRGSALVDDIHFQTIMGSAGTGRIVRNRELLVFSNPDIQCGGAPCGSPAGSAEPMDNAAVIRDTAPLVSGYLAAVSTAPVPNATAGLGDADGDGVTSDIDAFPFDPEESMDTDGDNVGDVADVYPDDPFEQRDTDGDGQGDFADSDDDNDGVNDFVDAFPLDATRQSNMDSDRVDDAHDFAPQDSTEWSDTDGDDVGNNSDEDADNDGWNDLHPSRQDILVVSVGNNRILRFDANSGRSRGIEVPPDDGLITFQSDVAFTDAFKQVFVTTNSSVVRYDPFSRQRDSVYVPAYATGGDGVELGSGFPIAIDFNAADGALEVAVLRRGVRAYGFDRPVYFGNDILPNEDFLPTEITRLTGDFSVAAVDWQKRRLLPNSAIFNLVENSDFGEVRGMAQLGNRLLLSDRTLSRIWSYELAADPVSPSDDFTVFAYMLPSREPYGIGVTANEKVLVSDAAGDEIIEFNTDGTFSRVLVANGAGGLSQPGRMAIVPAVLDRFPTDPTRVIRPNAGLWFNPESTGRGLDIQIFGNRLSAIWYTYDEDGLPTWYFSSGPLNGFDYEAAFDRVILNATGESVIKPAGTVQIRFSDERRASFSWSIGDSHGQEPVQWLAFDNDPAVSDATGLWGRSDGPGWGLSVVSQGGQSVAVAYVFDEAGVARWVISDPIDLSAGVHFPVNQVFAPHLCPSCTGAGDLVVKSAGSLDFNPDAQTWSSQITFTAPVGGQWSTSAEVVRFSDDPVRPR